MRTDVKQAMDRSTTAFRDIVWPVVADACGGGDLIPVESVTDAPFAVELDTLSGIDAWQAAHPHGMRGIASRVQWVTGQSFDTFTVRATLASGLRTEASKRRYAIDHGYLYPHYTIQAYLTPDGQLLAAGVANTSELIPFVCDWIIDWEDLEDGRWRNGLCWNTAPGGNRFVAVYWPVYVDAGHWLWRYEA